MVAAVTGTEDFGVIEPGTIKFSNRIDPGLGENPPITLGVEKSDPPPDEKHVPLLTVMYEADKKSFRIAVTLLAPNAALQALVVRWWALKV